MTIVDVVITAAVVSCALVFLVDRLRGRAARDGDDVVIVGAALRRGLEKAAARRRG